MEQTYVISLLFLVTWIPVGYVYYKIVSYGQISDYNNEALATCLMQLKKENEALEAVLKKIEIELDK